MPVAPRRLGNPLRVPFGRCPECKGTGFTPDKGSGAKLRALRARHDLTAAEVATEAGLSTGYLINLETDHKPATWGLIHRVRTAVARLRAQRKDPPHGA